MTDVAAGTWEAPGGCIEPGEGALQAAVREWCEETGAPFPEGRLESTWVSPNGVYQGFVYVVEREADVHINADSENRMHANPDDPDGDGMETCAWWDPEHLEGMPALRPELAATWPLVASALAAVDIDDTEPEDEDVLKEWRRWRENARTRVRKGQAPRRFTSDILPAADVNNVWAFLRTAKTKDEVDAAFVRKDTGPKDLARHSGHRWLDKIADHYAPLILDVLRSSIETQRVAALWVARVVKATDVDVDAAMAWLRENTPDLRFAGGLLDDLHRDGYAAGAQVAAAQVGADPVVNLIWDKWTPGHPEAASLLGNGANLEGLLASQGATIQGITDYTMDRLARALANGLLAGDSVTATAQRLDTIIDDPTRAYLIAVTETNRAMTAATLDRYRANGVEMYDVILADDACPECEDAATDNPHPLDDLDAAPPLHPSCRCSASPVFVLDDGTETEEEDLRPDPVADALVPVDPDTPFMDRVDMGKVFQDASTAQLETTTDDQQFALHLYTGQGYSKINGALRGNAALDEAQASLVSSIVPDLDAAIANGFQLSTDSTIYRGVGGRAADLVEGQVLQDSSFLSTSASETTARQFALDQGREGNYILEIAAPRGTNYVVGSTSERELLLARNTPMVIDRIDSGVVDGRAVNIPRVFVHIAKG